MQDFRMNRAVRRYVLNGMRLLDRPVRPGETFRGVLEGLQQFLQVALYLPTVLVRRFLQLFSTSIGKTRYFIHGFVLLLALGASATGLLRRGELGLAAETGSQYVRAFGTQVTTTKYAAMLSAGYLAKSNIATTDIRAKRTEGIQEYVVQGGDTVSTIAYRFNISIKTLQWGNQLQNVNQLKPGDKLLILPTSGVLHRVEDGQTVDQLAEKYGASREDIIAANDLIGSAKIIADQELVVPLPDDKIPDMPKPEPVRPAVASRPSGQVASGGGLAADVANVGSVVGGGQFGWPTTGRITQNFYQHRRSDGALDIANRSLPPIYASDGGVVTISGWDGTGYGRRIDINHGNGFITRYAHMSNLYVSAGQQVQKGQVIGQMGCTGYCSGPHVHFMIIKNGVPVNPQQYLP
jgi:murein DD-endopeptidase MepM/ murein hydrolase activator NlpD